VAQHPAGDRDHDTRQDRCDRGAEPEGCLELRREELRQQRYELAHATGGDPRVLGPDHAVDEADRELQPMRVAQYVGELLRRLVGGDLAAVGQPRTDQGDGVVCEGRDLLGLGRKVSGRLVRHGASIPAQSWRHNRSRKASVRDLYHSG